MAFLNVIINHSLGPLYPFTDESNTIREFVTPQTQVGYQFPSQAMLDTKRAVLVFPVTQGGRVTSVQGADITAQVMALKGQVVGHSPNGVPFILGAPVAGAKPMGVASIETADGEILIAPAIWVLIILLALFGTIVWNSYWQNQAIIEREKTEQLQIQAILKAGEIVKEELLDVNGDGIDDVRRVTYGNGDVWNYPLNEVGADFICGAVRPCNGVQVTVGTDLGDYTRDLLNAQTLQQIAIIAVVGGVAIVGLWVLAPEIERGIKALRERVAAR